MCPLSRDREFPCDWSDAQCLASVRSTRKLCQSSVALQSCFYCNKCDLSPAPASLPPPKPLPFTPIELRKCSPKPDFRKPPVSVPDCDNEPSSITLQQKHQQFQNLCEQFDSTCLSDFRPLVTKLYPEISEHDKKILSCMLTKRVDDTVRMEYALLARKYWNREREEREALLKQQHLDFAEMLRAKHETEKTIRQHRFDTIARQQQHCTAILKHELNVKRCRSKRRLEKALLERQVMHAQRQQDRRRKQELNAISLEKQRLDEQIRNGECSEMLEKRITRADCVRNQYLDAYRRRLNEENVRQQWVHAANFDEIKQMEKYNLQMLQQRMVDRRHKVDQFESNKMQWTERQRDRARITATLRDIVRKSTSPDNLSYRNYVHNLLKEA